MVFKNLLFEGDYDAYVQMQLYITAMEVLILERLSASPHIMDIYGYCGTSSIQELMPYEVDEIIVPESGQANRTILDHDDDVHPQNNLTPLEKVQLALGMAEALADVHGFQDGVILQGDNNIEQFLVNSNGNLKLGDFNLATILQWNDKEGAYCKRERRRWMESVSFLASYVCMYVCMYMAVNSP
jgi:serine/threonine protein kinase